MQSFSTGAFRYYSHTQNDMRKKVESMSVKKPVVPAAAEAPAADKGRTGCDSDAAAGAAADACRLSSAARTGPEAAVEIVAVFPGV